MKCLLVVELFSKVVSEDVVVVWEICSRAVVCLG